MNIKAFLLPAFLIAGMMQSFSQDAEIRQTPPFRGIEINSSARVFIKQSPEQIVKVSGGSRSSNITTEVQDNVLKIDGGHGSDIYVSLPELTSISLDGVGSVTGQSAFTGDKLDIEIGGNGKIIMDVQVKSLSAEISGVGNITLSGTADRADFNVSGSGKVDALDLKATSCNASISGLGKCLVDVTGELNAEISGSGKIYYKTVPPKFNKVITGIGDVTSYSGDSSVKDTTTFNLGDTQVLVIGKKKDKDSGERKIRPSWAGLEMGLNNFLDRDNNFGPPSGYSDIELRDEKSVFVGLNLFQKGVELGRSNIWFVTGLGFTWNNYRFDNNVYIDKGPNGIITYRDTSPDIRYLKSKLTMSYATVPVMFEVFTSRDPKKAFHIAAGGMFGLKLGSHSKHKYEFDGNVTKDKNFSSFYINPVRYGARASIGYRNFNVFAEYYFNSLFRDGKGPALYPVSAGITLVHW